MPLPFGLSASGAELERHAHLDDFPTGDYQLRVTIIEATALAARDASATSDPYVIVTVGAHSLRTSVSRKTISTTWGHVMSFELPGLTQARAERMSISVVVNDADTFGSQLIGATMIDLLKVWKHESHALWHTWVAVFSPPPEPKPGRRKPAVMSSGMLRISAVLLGPGARAIVPIEPFRDLTVRDLTTPPEKLSFDVLCVDVLSGLGLRALAPSRAPLRVVVIIRFAGVELRSPGVRVDDDEKPSSAWWGQKLRMPIALPALSDRVELIVIDEATKVPLAAQLVSYASLARSRISQPHYKPLQLYGAAVGTRPAVAEAMARGELAPTAWAGQLEVRMFRKRLGSPSRAGALLSGTTHAIRQMHVDSAHRAQMSSYSLVLRVYMAAGVPEGVGPVRVRVQMTHAEALTSAVAVGRLRVAEWNERLALAEPLPVERALQPSMFVSLLGASGALLAVAQLPVSALHAKGWISLRRVDSTGAWLAPSAGARTSVELLIEPNFGLMSHGAEPFKLRVLALERPLPLVRATLHASIFRANALLPRADDAGGPDTYVRLSVVGSQTVVRSETVDCSLAPTWSETLKLELALPTERALWPTATLEVWSVDTLGSHTRIGLARVPLSQAATSLQEVLNARVQRAHLGRRGGEDHTGEQWLTLGSSPEAEFAPVTAPGHGPPNEHTAPMGALLAHFVVDLASEDAEQDVTPPVVRQVSSLSSYTPGAPPALRFGLAPDDGASARGAGAIGSLLSRGRAILEGGVHNSKPIHVPTITCSVDVALIGLRGRDLHANDTSRRKKAVAAAEGQGPGRRAVVLVKDRAAAAADALEAMGGGLHLQSLAIEFELQPLGGEPPVRVRLPLHLGPGGVLNKPTTVRLTCTLPTDAGLCPDMTVRLYEEMASGMLGSRAPSVLMATGTLPLRAALEAAHPADVRHRLANMKEVGTVIVAAMALHNAAKTRGGLGGRSLAHMNSRSADDTGKARSSSAARKPGFLSRVLAPRARAKSAQRGSRAQEGASPTSESGKAPESGRRGSQTGEADGSRTARAQSVPPAIANPVDRLVRFGSTAKLPPLEPAETKPALQRKSSEILTMGSLGGQLGSALSSRKAPKSTTAADFEALGEKPPRNAGEAVDPNARSLSSRLWGTVTKERMSRVAKRGNRGEGVINREGREEGDDGSDYDSPVDDDYVGSAGGGDGMTVEHYLGGARDDADHVDEAGQRAPERGHFDRELEALPYGAHSGSLVAPPFFTMRLQRTRSNEVQTVAMLKYGLRVAVKPTHQGAAVLSGPASVAAATARVSSSERLDAAPRVESSAKVIVVENEKGKHSPEPVLIRVYVLSGHALAPVRAPSAPLGGLGGLVPLASLGIDTYLSAHLGGDTRLARAKTIDGSFEPLYHQFFEFETQLPGDGRVRLSVIERFAAPWLDEEIGYTEIDVEDRWFSPRWRALAAKPTERRLLWRESAAVAQGALVLWVDVVRAADAVLHPAFNIALPAPEPFEIRLILFETRMLRKHGTVRAIDPYVRVFLRGCDGGSEQMQETDVHWGVLDGTATFNWRFIFKLTLPLATRRSLEGIYLDVQAWDRTVLGEDELLSGGVIPLSSLCRSAWLSREWLKSSESTLAMEQGGRRRRFLVPLIANGGAAEAQSATAGEVACTVELMPASVAKKIIAGYGRDPPNRNPVLPEPIRSHGRMLTERMTAIIREEIQVGMSNSMSRAIEYEVTNRQRQLTPRRQRLVFCVILIALLTLIGIIVLQILANALVVRGFGVIDGLE